MTTSTEKMYAQVLGKLYTIPVDNWRVGFKPEPPPRTLVMPYRMTKHGGWWYFQCDILTNRDLYRGAATSISCKEFLRKAQLYHMSAAPSSEIS